MKEKTSMPHHPYMSKNLIASTIVDGGFSQANQSLLFFNA